MWVIPKISASAETLLFYMSFWHSLTDQRVRDVLTHVHMGIQSKHLKNKSNIALASRLLADLVTINVNFTRCWQLKPSQHSQRCCLTAA